MDATQDADRKLVEAVLDNRAGAFEQLVRNYQGLCWHVIQSLLDNIGDGHDLQAAHAQGEEERELHAAIEALPPLQRTLLTLYHLEELTVAEITTMTGLPEGTIKSHLFRSRKQLRELLNLRIGVAA